MLRRTGLAVIVPRIRRSVGLDDRLHLTRNFGLNASAFVDIDMETVESSFTSILDNLPRKLAPAVIGAPQQ